MSSFILYLSISLQMDVYTVSIFWLHLASFYTPLYMYIPVSLGHAYLFAKKKPAFIQRPVTFPWRLPAGLYLTTVLVIHMFHSAGVLFLKIYKLHVCLYFTIMNSMLCKEMGISLIFSVIYSKYSIKSSKLHEQKGFIPNKISLPI